MEVPQLLPALPQFPWQLPLTPLLNIVFFHVNSRSCCSFKQLLTQPDHPTPSTTRGCAQDRRAPGQGGTRPCWIPVHRMCSHLPSAPSSPQPILTPRRCWEGTAHVGDMCGILLPLIPHRKGSVLPQLHQTSPGAGWVPDPWTLWLPAVTSVIKTWYFAWKEQLLRGPAKSCNAFKRSKHLIPLDQPGQDTHTTVTDANTNIRNQI